MNTPIKSFFTLWYKLRTWRTLFTSEPLKAGPPGSWEEKLETVPRPCFWEATALQWNLGPVFWAEILKQKSEGNRGFPTYIMDFFQGAFLVAQIVKNLPAMQQTWVWSLGWEDPLEKEKTTYPLQYSGLENSMDYKVHGVVKCHALYLRAWYYSN